jgi:hypothetical protein
MRVEFGNVVDLPFSATGGADSHGRVQCSSCEQVDRAVESPRAPGLRRARNALHRPRIVKP